jgi:hypothetical protein
MLTTIQDNSLDNETNQAERALQGANTMLCTMLICGYLIFKQWEQRKLIGMETIQLVGRTHVNILAGKSQGSTGYLNIVAMIIESYVLESVWLLVMVILWNQSAGAFFTESSVYIEVSS